MNMIRYPFGLFTLAALAWAMGSKAQNHMAEYKDWPEGYDPATSSFFIHNDLFIAAPPERIWQVLIQAESWPSWYSGAKQVQIRDDHEALLSTSTFDWKTMGMRFSSDIRGYEENRLLAWESVRSGIRGYHVWLIIPEGNGCRVVTEESQVGWITFFEKVFQPKKLSRLHDEWLMGVKQLSEKERI